MPTDESPPTEVIGSWERVTDLPEAIGFMGATAYQGKIYAIAGGRRDIRQASDRAYRLDPASGRWERLPDLPMAAFSPSVFVLDDRLFVAGGSLTNRNVTAYDEVYEWIEATMSWRLHSRLPAGTAYPAGASTGERALVMRVGFGPEILDAVAVLDTNEQEWRLADDVPIFARHAAATDNAIWAIGEGLLSRFDPATDGWHPVVSSPDAVRFRGLRGAWAHDDHVHFVMRLQHPENVHLVYDAAADRWMRAEVPDGIEDWAAGASATLNGVLYLIGGYNNNDGEKPFPTVLRFRER